MYLLLALMVRIILRINSDYRNRLLATCGSACTERYIFWIFGYQFFYMLCNCYISCPRRTLPRISGNSCFYDLYLGFRI